MSQEKEYGIVLQLDTECSEEAFELNKICAEAWSDLKNPTNTWHVTLYHGAYKAKDLPEIYSKLSHLGGRHISLKLSKISCTDNRWIDWKVKNTTELHTLHHEVVKIASPYHTRPLERSKDIYESLNTQQKEQVDKYGVNGILDFYNPHSTIFYQYPPDERLKSIEQLLPTNVDMSCASACLILGELGYNGNITNVLYTQDFV